MSEAFDRDWDPEEFRAHGHRVVDWVADYLARVDTLPVLPHVIPGEIFEALPEQAPTEGEPFQRLLDDLDKVVLPGVTHWNHPGFFAYFGITASGPGILGELVAAALNTNAMLWKTSPATTELELRVLSWMLQMFDLPRDWFGQLVDTASIGTLVSLAAAREAQNDLAVRARGLAAPGHPRLRAYASEQAHSSVEKALITLGLGQEGLRKIPTDSLYRMDPRALRDAIREDRAAGFRPFAVVATVGTTSSTSVDPVDAIADICEAERLWLHVDAAYAGAAAILPEMRKQFAGCDRADSYLMNPHKWMFVPIDCSALYTRHPDILRRTFQLVPEYLRTEPVPGGFGAESAHETLRNSRSEHAEWNTPVDLMNYGVQLGRRFRAIKLWWVIRTFGVEGLQRRVRAHCELARRLVSWIEAEERFVLVAPVPFSTVCFRGRWPGLSEQEEDAANERLATRVSAAGPVFLAPTRLSGRVTLRLAIGNLRTEEKHVRQAFDLLLSLHEESGRVS
jgi:aromatic-L-amino-acid decarboxylase